MSNTKTKIKPRRKIQRSNKNKINKRTNYKMNNKSKTRRKIQRSKSNFKSNLARGGEPEPPVQCCMCENSFQRDTTLVPARCLTKHGERAHRICNSCWWNPETGFAREDAPHGCPGCQKGFPLTAPLKKRTPKPEDIIVLSDNDDDESN